jgi:hypothetical protein
MLRLILHAIVFGVASSIVVSADALEKRAVSFDPSGADDWSAGSSCRLRYYNTCIGWIWVWSGFPDDYSFGVVANAATCGENAVLLQSMHFIATSAPTGYGFTGTIAVHTVNAND